MSTLGKITRRTFLVGSVGIAGGVVFGYWKYKQPFDNPLEADLVDGSAALTPYVMINQYGVTIIAPRAEMGQGVHTTLAALVAEELELSLEQVKVIHGPASNAYFNAAVIEEGLPFAATDDGSVAEAARGFMKVPAKFLGLQITGGSSSIPDAYHKMRVAGAAARSVLVEVAAQQLGVDRASLTIKGGKITAADGRSLSFEQLASDAAKIEPPAEPTLKPKSAWKLLGKSQKRVDMISKSTGTAEFSIDIDLPNMVYASVRMNPQLGAPMTSFDASKAESMPGVKRIIQIDNGIAAIATNTWYAFKAVNAVDCNWAQAGYANDTAGLFKAVEQSFNDDHQDSQFRDDGDVEQALQDATTIDGEYRVPYLAHAAMEPLNATAWLRDGKLDIWAGNQLPTQALKEGANITGLDEADIRVHTTLMGGGFGRRAEMDFIIHAIKIAKEFEGTPVKTTWTREEDTTHDYYRPMAIARFKANLSNGRPNAIDLHLAAPSVVESQMGRLGVPAAGPDVSIVQAAWDQPYGVAHYRVTGYRTPKAFPVSSWRSVGASQNGFFHECMMDEIAAAGELDPLQMRLDLMNHDASRKVLEAVAEMSNWGAALPEGHGKGVAFVLSFGVPTAQVIEVQNTAQGIKLINAWAAVDVGVALDPRNIEAQVTGGMNFGLAAAMMGNITVKDGKVQETNFHNYNSIRINQVPNMAVRVLENGEKIRGIGEPGLPPAAPALANAIFAATGQRIRELPLSKHIRFL
ncbi:xanthine dehydrogenase family protein molybdopterin-binding subunit [Arenicella xantha]|uniref:Isoquinoline 1-oxidoreductase beta subunit n=1 Tax=Arenicella xantha TaxID=644221 RepID=A0A395JLK5_9GAMM|nr:molybdopterin cofactor-binding domain-containing protein [Arenicella xantha]RBP51642.1 isoquinoline 1-oxidoreductase beta subunit [Arenicella xantha]